MGRPSYQGKLRDILLTLLILDHSSLGRYKLSEYLNLTKAKTRAVLENLAEQGLVKARRGRGGSTLSTLGRSIVSKVKEFCYLDWSKECIRIEQELIGKEVETAIILINIDNVETSGLYERDMAVRQGAEGAITLLNQKGNWRFPNDDEVVSNIIILKSDQVEKYSMMAITFGQTVGAVYAASVAIVIYHLRKELELLLLDYFSD